MPALAHVFGAAPQQVFFEVQASQASAGGAPAVHGDTSEHSAAVLQLEALRVLLLFLPLPMPQVTLAMQLQSQLIASFNGCNYMALVLQETAAAAIILARYTTGIAKKVIRRLLAAWKGSQLVHLAVLCLLMALQHSGLCTLAAQPAFAEIQVLWLLSNCGGVHHVPCV